MSTLEPRFTRRSALRAAMMGGLGLVAAKAMPGYAAGKPLALQFGST